MKFKGRRTSDNVKDARGASGFSRGGMNNLGGLMGIISLFFRGGITKTKILILVGVIAVAYFLGFNPLNLLSGGNVNQAVENPTEITTTKEEDELMEFVKVVMADTEDVWHKIFKENGMTYKEPQLVVFRDRVQSACGGASSAMGPFYCSGDNSAYIDLSFCHELKHKFNVDGDFPLAYVIAHEVGHHIQNILGTSGKVHRQKNRLSEKEYNKLSVCLELQADFYAGVWAHHANKMFNSLEEGDIKEALNAAHAIGDDMLQKKFQGRVVPDSFTHGTSEQRMRWFKKGYLTGDFNQGDTFNAPEL